MFTSARLKLTAWYLLIIMLISGTFSGIIYSLINNELLDIQHNQRLKWERQVRNYLPIWEAYKIQQQLQGLPSPEFPEELKEPDFSSVEVARGRVQRFLLLVNAFIFASAGLAGYFLASRTLKPIKVMVDDQNRFVTDASHELRTPLTSLRTELEVNLLDKSLTIKEAKKLLKSNLEEVIHLQTLSDNLMKLTRYSKGYNHVNFEEINISELVSEAIKKVAPLAKSKKIKIENQSKEIFLKVEKLSITELFVILLDNAIKYSPEKTTVKINSSESRKHLIVKVIDQGIGISKNEIPHLFDRFYRADSSRNKTTIDGYGLGLSIARQIIERHSGEISVKSKVGEGTTFIISLPIKR